MIYDWSGDNPPPFVTRHFDANGMSLPKHTWHIDTDTGYVCHYLCDANGKFVMSKFGSMECLQSVRTRVPTPITMFFKKKDNDATTSQDASSDNVR